MLEIGTFRGGGALHLSNCCVNRQIIVCDPFDAESFEHVNPNYDQQFQKGQFVGSSEQAVVELLKGRNAVVIPGYFPHSVKSHQLPRISFIHLDVDVYKATKDSLLFTLDVIELCADSLIVVDDYNRGADGVNVAIKEVAEQRPGTLVFPLFPGQALVIPRLSRIPNVMSLGNQEFSQQLRHDLPIARSDVCHLRNLRKSVQDFPRQMQRLRNPCSLSRMTLRVKS